MQSNRTPYHRPSNYNKLNREMCSDLFRNPNAQMKKACSSELLMMMLHALQSSFIMQLFSDARSSLHSTNRWMMLQKHGIFLLQ